MADVAKTKISCIIYVQVYEFDNLQNVAACTYFEKKSTLISFDLVLIWSN